MTLLITVFAAIVSTIAWYKHAPDDIMKISTLCYLYWGASLMWLVDAVFEYAEAGAEYFTPDAENMLNDAFLGLAVIAFALVVWVLTLLICDQKGILKAALQKKQN